MMRAVEFEVPCICTTSCWKYDVPKETFTFSVNVQYDIIITNYKKLLEIFVPKAGICWNEVMIDLIRQLARWRKMSSGWRIVMRDTT